MIASAFNMGSVEGGAMPGEPLTAVQTFLYFVVTPVGLFLLITVLVLAGTREKKKTEPSKKPSSVIDSIDLLLLISSTRLKCTRHCISSFCDRTA